MMRSEADFLRSLAWLCALTAAPSRFVVEDDAKERPAAAQAHASRASPANPVRPRAIWRANPPSHAAAIPPLPESRRDPRIVLLANLSA